VKLEGTEAVVNRLANYHVRMLDRLRRGWLRPGGRRLAAIHATLSLSSGLISWEIRTPPGTAAFVITPRDALFFSVSHTLISTM